MRCTQWALKASLHKNHLYITGSGCGNEKFETKSLHSLAPLWCIWKYSWQRTRQYTVEALLLKSDHVVWRVIKSLEHLWSSIRQLNDSQLKHSRTTIESTLSARDFPVCIVCQFQWAIAHQRATQQRNDKIKSPQTWHFYWNTEEIPQPHHFPLFFSLSFSSPHHCYIHCFSCFLKTSPFSFNTSGALSELSGN